MRRARIVSEPLSDYQRWSYSIAAPTVSAPPKPCPLTPRYRAVPQSIRLGVGTRNFTP
ncbi:DUF6879 family protein [Nocardia tengchongensis]|uniref:DUF6879 family protein n=1 Tax=Nocardia tengchongensis TaxID=2055889 RepID=UPI0036C472A4